MTEKSPWMAIQTSIPVAVFFIYFMVIKKTPWKKMPFSKEEFSFLPAISKHQNHLG
jgi:hypothetical protein